MVYYVLKNETKIFVDSIHADDHHPTPSFLFFYGLFSLPQSLSIPANC